MTMVEGAVTFRDVMARLAAAVNVATAVSGEGQHTGALVLEGALVSFDRTIDVVEFATQSAFLCCVVDLAMKKLGDGLVYFDEKCLPLRPHSLADNARLDPGSSAYRGGREEER